MDESPQTVGRSAERLQASWAPAAPNWLLAVMLAAATMAVYAPSLRNGFVDFDDRDYVTENVHVRSGLTWRNVGWAFRSLEAGNWHPLTWISHMADCQAFGLNPAGHHAVSVALHALNAVGLFLLLAKVTGLRWRSLFVAGLFALHPLNVETVAWLAERKSLLSMFFSLLAVGCYGMYARAAESERGLKRRSYLGLIVFFALALMAKPMAVTLPLVLLILDYWPLERMPVPFSGSPDAEFWKKLGALTVEKVPLFAMSAASAWITVLAQSRAHATSSMAVLPMRQRLGNALVSCVKYIGKMLWPSGLSYYYPHPGNRQAAWEIAASALVLLAIGASLWRWRERRHLVFGWKLYFVTLLPVIGIVQVGLQGMADRYAYIPLIGLFVVLVWEVSAAAERWRVPVAARGAAVTAVGAALAVTTVANIGYWRDSVTLGEHARAVIPFANTRIESNLGAALLDRGRSAEALEHFRIAEFLAPDLFVPHFNIGYALAQSGQNAQALPELQAAVKTASDKQEKSRAVNAVAACYLDLGQNDQAAQAFSELLALRPDSVAGLAGRGQANFNLARYQAASDDFARAARERPAPELFLMAGKALEGAGKLQDSADAYRKALQSNPGLNEAQQRLESIEKQLGMSRARSALK